jgi:hypothetical protein
MNMANKTVSTFTVLVLPSKNCSTTVVEHGAHEITEKTIMGSQKIFSLLEIGNGDGLILKIQMSLH